MHRATLMLYSSSRLPQRSPHHPAPILYWPTVPNHRISSGQLVALQLSAPIVSSKEQYWHTHQLPSQLAQSWTVELWRELRQFQWTLIPSGQTKVRSSIRDTSRFSRLSIPESLS